MELKLSHVLEQVSHRFTPEHYKQDGSIRSEKGKIEYQRVSTAISNLVTADVDKFWVVTFDHFFISCSSERRDDLLFYVKYDTKNVRHTYIHIVMLFLIQQKKDEVYVLRKDSKSLPELVRHTQSYSSSFMINLGAQIHTSFGMRLYT